MPVTREVHVDAPPEEVWEALVTEEGRARWLEEPERDIRIEEVREPERLVWWWEAAQEPATRVEFQLEPTPAGTRVRVTESLPSFPLAMLASGCMRVAA